MKIFLDIHGFSLLASSVLFLIFLMLFMILFIYTNRNHKDLVRYKPEGWQKESDKGWLMLLVIGLVMLTIILLPLIFWDKPNSY